MRCKLPRGLVTEWRAAHGRMWAEDPALDGIELDREAAEEWPGSGVGFAAMNAEKLQLNYENVVSHLSVLGVLDDILESVEIYADEDDILAAHVRRLQQTFGDDVNGTDDEDDWEGDASTDEGAIPETAASDFFAGGGSGKYFTASWQEDSGRSLIMA